MRSSGDNIISRIEWVERQNVQEATAPSPLGWPEKFLAVAGFESVRVGAKADGDPFVGIVIATE